MQIKRRPTREHRERFSKTLSNTVLFSRVVIVLAASSRGLAQRGATPPNKGGGTTSRHHPANTPAAGTPRPTQYVPCTPNRIGASHRSHPRAGGHKRPLPKVFVHSLTAGRVNYRDFLQPPRTNLSDYGTPRSISSKIVLDLVPRSVGSRDGSAKLWKCSDKSGGQT